MKITFLFAALLLANCIFQLTGKGCSNILKDQGVAGNSILLFINGTISSVVFLIFTDFEPKINNATVWLSVLFAVVCMIATIVGIVIYRYSAISSVVVAKNSLSLIATFVAGAVVFHENVDLVKVIRVVIMVASAILIFVDCRKGENMHNNKGKFFF